LVEVAVSARRLEISTAKGKAAAARGEAAAARGEAAAARGEALKAEAALINEMLDHSKSFGAKVDNLMF
jgi:hypothetical protein